MKIGFIGVGGIAGNYLNSLQKLNRSVVAVCDVNLARAQQVASEQNAKAYGNHREMLASEKLDVAFICIPPFAHDTQVADAAQAGAALFVAKPVGLYLDQALKTRDVVAKAGVLNQAGYMARYSTITDRAKELVGDRKLGMGTGRFLCNMGSGHPWWGDFAKSGGQMLEQTTHCFDWLRYFLGDVEEVHAYGHRANAGDTANFEDSSVCNLGFKSGAVGNILSTCVTNVPSGFGNELFGREFYLHADHDHILNTRIDGKQDTFRGEESGYFRQVEEFLRAVDANDQGLIRSSFEDAVKTLAVTLAANESLAQGQPVKVAAV